MNYATADRGLPESDADAIPDEMTISSKVMAIADLHDSQVVNAMRQYERPFMVTTAVDLLAMSNALPAPDFHLYTQLSREWRRRKKLQQQTVCARG